MQREETIKAYANYKIVMTGYAGLCGAAEIADSRMSELKTQYTSKFVEEVVKKAEKVSTEYVEGLKEYFFVAAEIGGVFNALWELYMNTGCGIEVELMSIPVTQGTIEICEFFDINPYMLYSKGVYLFISNNEHELIDKLMAYGINSSIIGHLTNGSDKIIKNGSEKRYIVPARGCDELYKVIRNGGREYERKDTENNK